MNEFDKFLDWLNDIYFGTDSTKAATGVSTFKQQYLEAHKKFVESNISKAADEGQYPNIYEKYRFKNKHRNDSAQLLEQILGIVEDVYWGNVAHWFSQFSSISVDDYDKLRDHLHEFHSPDTVFYNILEKIESDLSSTDQEHPSEELEEPQLDTPSVTKRILSGALSFGKILGGAALGSIAYKAPRDSVLGTVARASLGAYGGIAYGRKALSHARNMMSLATGSLGGSGGGPGSSFSGLNSFTPKEDMLEMGKKQDRVIELLENIDANTSGGFRADGAGEGGGTHPLTQFFSMIPAFFRDVRRGVIAAVAGALGALGLKSIADAVLNSLTGGGGTMGSGAQKGVSKTPPKPSTPLPKITGGAPPSRASAFKSSVSRVGRALSKAGSTVSKLPVKAASLFSAIGAFFGDKEIDRKLEAGEIDETEARRQRYKNYGAHAGGVVGYTFGALAGAPLGGVGSVGAGVATSMAGANIGDTIGQVLHNIFHGGEKEVQEADRRRAKAYLEGQLEETSNPVHRRVIQEKLDALNDREKRDRLGVSTDGEIRTFGKGERSDKSASQRQVAIDLGLDPEKVSGTYIQGKLVELVHENGEVYKVPEKMDSDAVSIVQTPKEPEIVRVVGEGKGYSDVEMSDGSIVRREGSYSWRHNNSGNLEDGKFARARGAVEGAERYAAFPTLEDGERARKELLFTHGKYRNWTLSETIKAYAPPHENNTQKYIDTVVGKVGSDKKMSEYTEKERQIILDAMKRHEGFRAGKETVLRAPFKNTGREMPSAAKDDSPRRDGVNNPVIINNSPIINRLDNEQSQTSTISPRPSDTTFNRYLDRNF